MMMLGAINHKSVNFLNQSTGLVNMYTKITSSFYPEWAATPPSQI